jgi:uncharacterized membrane-anchored protein YitT (DUF2179 family)
MLRGLKLRNLAGIVLGAAIIAFGINYFNIANRLAEGGVTGITILLKLAFDLEPGLMMLAINLPLLGLGWKLLGRRAVFTTIWGTAWLSLFLWVFGHLRLPMKDLLLASLFAGVTVGAGIGVVFRSGGTTGGVDIIARILEKYAGWKVGRTMLLADVAVIGVSLVYLTKEQAMYTLVAVFVGTRVIDFMQDAAYSARAALIVSERPTEVAKAISAELDRGCTFLHGRGAYSQRERDVIYVVVGRSELFRLKQLVHDLDPTAFISVSEASEVLGEGFTLDGNKQPIGA